MADMTVNSHATQVKTASGLNVIAAIWLFVSAFVVTMPLGVAWSNGITAIVIFVLALIRTGAPSRTVGLSWVNVVLGIWVFFSQWIIADGAAGSGAIINNVITGGVIFVLAFWSALAGSARGVETTGLDDSARRQVGR
jgi:hypothetical protein